MFVYVRVFDREVDREERELCDQVNALANRNQVGCVFLAAALAWCSTKQRGASLRVTAAQPRSFLE